MIEPNRTRHAPVPPPSTAPARRPGISRKENLRSILSTIAVLLIAPIVAIVLTAFVFQSYQVDGPSMKNTLQPNDRLIIWKLPKTWAKLTGNPYIPKRGDIVVFTEHSLTQFNEDPGKQLIKRVIGLPGERVVVADGSLTIYNQDNPQGFRPDLRISDGVVGNIPIEGDWTIGENQIFVMGDNRTNSLDSRTFGPVNAHDIVGKLTARVLPLGEIKKF